MSSYETLYESELLSVREWHLPADDDCEWSDAYELIDPAGPVVVFPRWPVLIKPADSRPVLATPNIAMRYRAGTIYQRELRDPRGDEALYIRVFDRELPPGTHAPTDAETYLRQHLLGRYLRGEDVDALLVETIAASLVDRASGGGTAKAAISAAHRRLAEQAQELLAVTVRASPTLHELAKELSVSPFHLARVFRRVTGFGLHEYRRQLRLRLALRHLRGHGGLTELAFELGFASHSHFTDAFRKEFGVTPSDVARRDAGELLAA